MIYVLPGMGADHRMYRAPWSSLPDCHFINWPQYAGEKTLTDVARSVMREYEIQQGAWLVGSSLGGMVACEITKFIPVRGLILVGSAQSKDEVGLLLTWLSPFIGLAPLGFIQKLAGKAPTVLTQMFKDSDPSFVRTMCRAIMKWEGLADANVTLHRIHGRKDLVIPLPKKVQVTLEGGHLIAMTHAQACVAFVRTVVNAT